VRAGLGAFFQHDYGDILTFFGRQLLEANGGGQATGATAHHHHVIFHGLSRAVLGQDLFVCHRESLA
jgi:hypothetical protein